MDAPKVRATKTAPVAPSAAVSAITSNPVKTRDDAFDLFSSLLTPLVESQSEGGARVRLQAGGATFDSIAADFEGYARTLWGLAPALASEPDHPVLRPVGDRWARGLDAGTNPDHPEFWGWPVHYDQRFVEMAGLGVAIGLVPQVFWDSQTEEAKLRIAKWLLTINEVEIPENNWRCELMYDCADSRLSSASECGIEARWRIVFAKRHRRDLAVHRYVLQRRRHSS